MSLHLCMNCLEPGARSVPVGYPTGNQRDPTQETVDLCAPCREALLKGQFPSLNQRYVASREIRR